MVVLIDQARLTTSRILAAFAVVASLSVVVGAGAASAATAGAVIGRQRPTAPVSADGLQASDGQRTLRVGQAADIDPAGAVIGVSGSGYDVNKGIYVAFCVVTPPDSAPSPCSGGADQTGSSGASAWISSNPPSYGEGLTVPYGPGGSFSVNIAVAPLIAGGFDCRSIQCAIVTRNDHVRTADRTQDILVPITFGAGDAAPPVPTEPTPTVPPETTPPTTIAPPPPPSTTEAPPAPEATVSEDGLSVSDGTRTLTASKAADLDPEIDTLTVTGEAFDPAKGIQVTLCQVASSPTEPAAPCRAGASPDASRLVMPPATDGVDAEELSEDGAFEIELEVAATIDDDTDCREVECAVVVRHYSVDEEQREAVAADRTLDLALPVTFAAESAAEDDTTTTTTTEAAVEDDAVEVEETDDGGGFPTVPVLIGAVVLAAVGIAAWRLRGRRDPSGPSGDGS